MDKLTNSVKINDVSPNDFVALYVPGGHGAPQGPHILEECPAAIYFPCTLSNAVLRNMMWPGSESPAAKEALILQSPIIGMAHLCR
jgi:hypothetical protein